MFFLNKLFADLFLDTLFWYLFFVVFSRTTFLQIILLFLFDVVPLCFRSPFSFSIFISFSEPPSVFLLFLGFVFFLCCIFQSCSFEKPPFTPNKRSYSKISQNMFSEFLLGWKNSHKLFFHRLFHFHFLIFLNVKETVYLLLLVLKKTS